MMIEVWMAGADEQIGMIWEIMDESRASDSPSSSFDDEITSELGPPSPSLGSSDDSHGWIVLYELTLITGSNSIQSKWVKMIQKLVGECRYRGHHNEGLDV